MTMLANYVLIGAGRWLRLLAEASPSAAMAILMARPEYADLTNANYREAYEWLESVGLVDRNGPDPSTSILRAFEAAVRSKDLSWTQDDSAFLPSPDLLPEPIRLAADNLGLDLSVAWQETLRIGAKLDLERRSRIGHLGEVALVEYLRSTGFEVEHLSLQSDGLGWDVLVRDGHFEAHVEVKSTTSRARLRIYLTRNEYEVSLRDDRWSLALLLIDESGALLRIAHSPKQTFVKLVPVDSHGGGRWESCRLDLSPKDLQRGLVPELRTRARDDVLDTSIAPSWWPSN